MTKDGYGNNIDYKNPQTLNLYSYCGNNPVSRVDPTGEFWWFVIMGIAAFEETPEGQALTEDLVEEGEALAEKGLTAAEEYASSVAQYMRLKGSLATEEMQSVVETTGHGVEQLISRGFSPSEISDVLQSPSTVMTQTDGATVFIKDIGEGKFNVIVKSENGVVTALKNISQKSLNNLAKNYGWN